MIEFQTDMLMPPPRKRLSKYPMGIMPVGASFFTAEITSKTIGGFTSYHAKRGKKFSCRTVTENGVKGIRIWRIA